MSSSNGLLLVLADPAATIEGEFNEWYDTEHLPERRILPGFQTALRFKSIGDGSRYLALYDLDDLSVLESDPYLAVSGANFSPWTRRLASRTHPLRITARQLHPGKAKTGACARLLLMRFRGVGDAEGLARQLDVSLRNVPGFLQCRSFVCEEPDPSWFVAIAEFATNRVPDVDGRSLVADGAVLDLAATYRAYRA
jgi:hypothetical protein